MNRPPSMPRHFTPEGGFTLLELMIAMMVFSIGMLGLSSLFAMQVNINAGNIRHNVANNIALSTIEQAKDAPYHIMAGWPATQADATIPCQGAAAANQADRVDCLKPDTADPTVPPAPYNTLVSDAQFVPIDSLAAQGLVAANKDYVSAMEVQRTITIQPNVPAPNMKIITVQVDWRVAGTTNVRTITYTTVRDMGTQ